MSALHRVASKIFFGIVFFAAAIVIAVVIKKDTVTHGANLISVNLSPTTTLTAQTSNNTSGANTFTKNWPNGDENVGNVSKVNIHTLLYPGNTTKIFALVEPWFCTTSAGEVSDSYTNACQSHLQNGNNEDSTAYVNSMVADMESRGIDGATCDFEGVGTSGSGDSTKQVNALGVCDKISTATAASGGKLMMDAMEDSASWKYECASATGQQACVLGQMERDLAHIATYYSSPSYYKVNGRPVLLFFLAENEETNTNWSTLWTQLKTWATANAGDPLFVQERQLLGGGNDDGIYDWPATDGANSDETTWSGNGDVMGFLNKINGSDSGLTVREGTAFKGFNDTLASWSMNRIINQNCGETWANGIWNAPAQAGFSASNQLPSVLIATWSDYEEGTEIETGISNCLGISASTNTNILSWNVDGQTNTLDHYTVYISTDGQNLAVLQDNISPSVTSLNLAQYDIPSGSYTLYIQAVGKPSIINNMSNAVTYAVDGGSPGGGSCAEPIFNAGTVSVATTTPGGSYTISCDYGFDGPGIIAYPGSGKCTYSQFNGTIATFNCTAGTTTGVFQNSCGIDNGNTLNYCAATSSIASLIVVSPTVTVSTTPSADVSVLNVADVTSTIEGGAISYTITVRDLGPAVANGVVATDLLPSGLSFENAVPSEGPYQSVNGKWNIGTLAPGASDILTIGANADAGTAGTNIINTASVTASASTTDPNSSNNSSSASVAIANPMGGTPTSTIPSADISIMKTANVTSAVPGNVITYTLTVTDNGPATSTGVVVTDILPAGLTVIAVTPSQGTYSVLTGNWNIGTVRPGTSETLAIDASVNSGIAGTTIANTASVVESASTTDPDIANDRSTVSVAITIPCVVNCQGSTPPAGGAGGGGGGGGGGSPSIPTPIQATSTAISNTTSSVKIVPASGSSAEALLQSLLQELELLIKQLNSQLVVSFNRDLTIGSVGTDVQNLQVFLNDNGYPVAQVGPGSPGNESMHFGPETSAALAKFQTAHGLPATGYFGNLTRAYLIANFAPAGGS